MGVKARLSERTSAQWVGDTLEITQASLDGKKEVKIGLNDASCAQLLEMLARKLARRMISRE